MTEHWDLYDAVLLAEQPDSAPQKKLHVKVAQKKLHIKVAYY